MPAQHVRVALLSFTEGNMNRQARSDRNKHEHPPHVTRPVAARRTLGALVVGLLFAAGAVACTPTKDTAATRGGCAAPATWEDGRPVTADEAQWINAACARAAYLDEIHNHRWMVATRTCESGGNYSITSNPTYRGAYQFLRSTWDSTVRSMGYFWLIGVDPAAASVSDQDEAAWHLSAGGTNRSPWPVCGYRA